MGEDDQRTWGFGEPGRTTGPTPGDDAARRVTRDEQQTHVFGGSDQSTQAFRPGRGPAPDPTRTYATADDQDTGRLPAYHEGSSDESYREVRDSYYDADYVARQRAGTSLPPPQPEAPMPPATRHDQRALRRRGRLMLALGIVIGLVAMALAAAVREATRTPAPVPTVTATATVTATVTRTPLITVPTRLPSVLPSVSGPLLPTGFPSFQLPKIPGLNSHG
ncbi:hypothetical protein [Raineyella fluvialis]|uniref:Uncharacterized protein n=1 Tax=Raineyella fluvialis TaxID=2662261 RepID=A0A5Q2FCQ4_9ACTN|nr:hypothetical protein [Raineyella fluvialis]QGF24870.1 hypothetical protein Rai3103_15980 [Raineyella fluvialis]